MPADLSPYKSQTMSGRLLDWYDRHRRFLPWRVAPGQFADPYRVWLSEIMLQQTTVATVTAYFDRFMARWPNVHALAAASLDDVLHAWQGLGYYARARNLHACAKEVAVRFDGIFPDTEAGLRELPGVGGYTAAAVAAIAFDRSAVVVDGNVERVMSRLFSVDKPLSAAKPLLYEHAASLTPKSRAGDYAQAVMDLGATICTPRNPGCILCPWSDACTARKSGDVERFPIRVPKAERPKRYATVFFLRDDQGRILLRRRADRGLLGGMMEFPSSTWESISSQSSTSQAPLDAINWRILPDNVIHVFTHFQLEFTIAIGQVNGSPNIEGVWVYPKDFSEHALPTLMKKVVNVVSKISNKI